MKSMYPPNDHLIQIKVMRYVFCLGIVVGMLTGCVTPEGAPSFCPVKPGDTYRYFCEDGTARCTSTTGDVKFVGCFLEDGVYCVEACK